MLSRALADAGYWDHRQMQTIEQRGIEVLVPPDGNMREGKRRGWEHGVYQQIDTKSSGGCIIARGRHFLCRTRCRADRAAVMLVGSPPFQASEFW